MYFAVLPLFALTNADVSFLGGDVLAMVSSPVFFGVFFGLLLGKPIGILLFSFLTVNLKIANLPDHVNWIHMLGAGILGGVGFTMAIFVANLAFPEAVLIADAKIGILSASLLAGVIGFLFLFMQAKAAERQGISYVSASLDEVVRQTAGEEAADMADDVVLGCGDEDLVDDVREVLEAEGGVAEFVVHEIRDEAEAEEAAPKAEPAKKPAAQPKKTAQKAAAKKPKEEPKAEKEPKPAEPKKQQEKAIEEPRTSLRTIRRALRTIVRENSDEDNWIMVSQVGNLLDKRYTDFDVRNFGFSKLTPFLESLDMFEIKDMKKDSSSPQKYVRLK